MRQLTGWLAGTGLLLAAVSPAAAQRHPFPEGQPFPILALPDLEHSRPASLADFRGRKLVLHVFASW